jgi:hypothetical protein
VILAQDVGFLAEARAGTLIGPMLAERPVTARRW